MICFTPAPVSRVTDVARPAEFLLDSKGTVRWINRPTENYRVRRSAGANSLEAAKLLK